MKKRLQNISLTLIGLFLFASSASGAGYQMKVEFPGYTNRTDTLTNFPVLVVLSNNIDGSGLDFGTTPFLSEDGYDLRFRDSGDTTDLNYEIEKWDTNLACYVWVQVDEIPGDGSGYIWAKWGLDATQQPCTTNGAVWSEDYEDVWHMAQTDPDDSTAATNNGTASGDISLTNNATVNGGIRFDGNDDYITMNLPSVFNNGMTSDFTFSFWARIEDLTPSVWTRLLDARYDDNNYMQFVVPDNNQVMFYVEDAGIENKMPGPNTLNSTDWYHFAGTWDADGSTGALYVNGTDQSGPVPGLYPGEGDYQQLRLGGRADSANYGDYAGWMDEVRVSTIVRSTNWVWADYMTAASNTVFSEYGSVTSLVSDTPLITTGAATGLATNGATLNGTLTSTGTSVTAVSVYWEQTDTDQGETTSAWANVESFGDYTGGVPNNFATNITGLTAGTTYTYRYYATNDTGEAWGGAESFTSWEAPDTPTIDAPSQTSWVHVAVSGAVTGGNPDPHAYFCLNLGSDGGTGGTSSWDIVESAGTQSGSFTNTIAGLTQDTLYYARVYVTNEAGDAWSSDINFTTEVTPAQLTLSADDQIDGADPELVFDEAPDLPLAGTGASPNWTFDFSYYGSGPAPVDLSTNMLFAGNTDPRGTITLDLNGGNMNGTGALAIRTHQGLTNSNDQSAHHLTITNVGSIDMGGVDTSGNTYRGGYLSGSTAYGGNICIGSESSRAGTIRADYLYARRFDNHETQDGGYGGAGSITVYSDGDVLIKDPSDTPGNLRTDTYPGTAGRILIDHQGNLTVDTINADTVGFGYNYPHPGSVILNGGDSSGDASVNAIQASLTAGKSSNDDASNRRTIAISNYNDVVVGPITARYEGDTGNGEFYGSHVQIERNISGDITINGQIDVRSYKDHNHSGYLKLACTGTVTLAELDLDKVLYASLDSGSGASGITGVITNFDISGATGSGTLVDPKNPPETGLRIPADQRLYYSEVDNPDLGGYVWQLRNLDDSGAGGLLMVRPASGTVMYVR